MTEQKGQPPFNPDPLAAKVPLWLPMGFVVTALVSGLLFTAAAVAFWPRFQFLRLQPELLATVHLFTLGFGSAVTVGVLYQMAPVVLVTKLHSPAVGWASLAAFVPGMAILVGSFYKFHIPGLVVGAAATVFGAALFAYNMWHTWRASPEDSLTRRFILPAVASFLLTLLFGFTIALTWRFGWRFGPRGVDLLGAHLFLGAGGWFTGIVVGVSYRLIPMFRLVHGHDETFGHRILRMLYGGVALGVLAPFVTGIGANIGSGMDVSAGTAALGTLLETAGSLMTTAGLLFFGSAVVAYAWDFRKMWHRSLRAPDVWMAQVPWSIGYLLAALLAVVVMHAFARFGAEISVSAVLGAGLLFTLGFVGTMVLALLHKIVPFLVWYHRYMGQIGRAQVPLMKDLVDEGRGKIGFIMYHSALVMTAVALLTGVSEAGRAIAPLIAVAFLVLASDLVPLFAPVPEAGTEPDPRPSTARAAADAGAATSSGGAGFKRTR